MAFSAKDTAEIFSLEIVEQHPILFYASQHFARTENIEIKLGGLSQEFLVKAEGSGTLFLKVYGKLIEKLIDSNNDEELKILNVICEPQLNCEHLYLNLLKKIITHQIILIVVLN